MKDYILELKMLVHSTNIGSPIDVLKTLRLLKTEGEKNKEISDATSWDIEYLRYVLSGYGLDETYIDALESIEKENDYE